MTGVNRRRGEIAAQLDGRHYRLCLTLGALAELEDAFAAEDLNQLVQRFASGRLSARDMLRIIAAGLRGGGHTVSDEEVCAMQCEDGAAGYARIVGALLVATFGTAETGAAQSNP
ncbi:gene transfer agent family protein [Nitratireductor sp. ZSWI3]|uniref:gene transfer agent family protein n=1 Tax=Nitratireductor sp. ZSWI3 TaxID=2966359 RepID=UPI00214F6CD9|nr:gene transfer agent family protein [Nitratireductor sp. ZSWI3]MCR4265356.1 gene transfer agent family protein [Nitratireductor sp. ZSWI3]